MDRAEREALEAKVHEDLRSELRLMAGTISQTVRCHGLPNYTAAVTASAILSDPDLTPERCWEVEKKIRARRRAERKMVREAMFEKRSRASRRGWAKRQAIKRQQTRRWKKEVAALVG